MSSYVHPALMKACLLLTIISPESNMLLLHFTSVFYLYIQGCWQLAGGHGREVFEGIEVAGRHVTRQAMVEVPLTIECITTANVTELKAFHNGGCTCQWQCRPVPVNSFTGRQTQTHIYNHAKKLCKQVVLEGATECTTPVVMLRVALCKPTC